MKKALSLVLTVLMLFSALCLQAFAQGGTTTAVTPAVTPVVTSGDGYMLSGLQLKSSSSVKKRSVKTVIPSSYDSRDYGNTIPVRNQGSTGSCWAFAAINSLESYAVVNGLEDPSDVEFSQSHLVWYAYSLSTDTDDPLCGEGYTGDSPYNIGGNWLRATAALSRWSGIAELDDFPFYPYDTASMSSFSEDGRYNHGSGYVMSDAIFLSSDSEIKQWIMDNGSCTMGIYYDSSCESDNDAYYSGTSSDYMNHNVSVVGWDDDYSADNFNTDPGCDGAWLIKDSWGSYIHNGGYYWLSYAEPTNYNYCVGYTLRSDDELYKNYTYSGIGFNGSATLPDGSAVSNVFEADGYEAITSVSFFTEQTGITADISVYINLPSDYDEPSDGTLALTSSVSVPSMGYHTYSLPGTIEVSPGTVFAISVAFNTSDGSDVILPVEMPGDYSASGMYITSEAGQSYYYIPANGCYLDADDSGIGNFWVQAATKCRHQMVTTTVSPTCTESGMTCSVCSQCGLKGVSAVLPATGHDYGAWSEYTRSGNLMVSTKTCKNCGDQIQKSYRKATENTITIDVLLARIFDYFFGFLRKNS